MNRTNLYIYWTEREVGELVIRSYSWLRLPTSQSAPKKITYRFVPWEKIPMKRWEPWRVDH